MRGEFYSSRYAALALAQLGAAGVPALLEAGPYRHAVEALGEIRARDALPLLIEALNNALRSGADCSWIEPGKEFEIHSGPHTAARICQALGHIGDPSAVQALTTAETSTSSN
jgi:HEAT repeat protein